MLKGAGDFRALIMAAAMIGHVPPVSAQPDPDARARFVAGARAMMAELGGESRDDARRIAAVYGKGGTLRMFRDRDDLRAVTRQGVVAPFPVANNWFNVRPRLSGSAPIGEKDLAHQELYVAARP